MHSQCHTLLSENMLKVDQCTKNSNSPLLNIVTNIIPIYRTKEVQSQEIIKHLLRKIQLHLDLVNPVLPVIHHNNHLRGQREDKVILIPQMMINHLVNSFNEPDIPLISLLFFHDHSNQNNVIFINFVKQIQFFVYISNNILMFVFTNY